jgi:hypothetical protein
MKKINFKAAALVVAAAVATVFTSCSSEDSLTAEVKYDVDVYKVSTNVENGCPTATAQADLFKNEVFAMSANLTVTLAEEQIAIPSDQDFGTAYSSGNWETGFEYTDGQTAKVTWSLSKSAPLKVASVVFNEDKTVVEPAADGMSAKITLSFTATINYEVDGEVKASDTVELNPWYTQVKVENTPAVTEPTYSYDYENDLVIERDGGSILLTKWSITRIWNGETKVFSIPNDIILARVPLSQVDNPQTVQSLEYKDLGVSVGDATVAEKTFGNYTRVSDTRLVHAELHTWSPAGGELSTIDDRLTMMSSVITFTDPETGYSLYVDMTMNVADHKVSFVDKGLDYVQLHEETVKKDYWTTLQYEVDFSSSSTAVPQWNNSNFAQFVHEKHLSHGNVIE